MDGAWELLVARDDLSKVDLVGTHLPQLADGEVLLKVHRVGMTANNVTYGVTGIPQLLELLSCGGRLGTDPLVGFLRRRCVHGS